VPDLGERALPGWGAIGFRHPQAGHIAALFPEADGVKLVFEHGARLDDPDGLLEGTTRQTRHVSLRSTAAIRHPALTDLVRQAVADRLTTP
jgi:hypothetical protein